MAGDTPIQVVGNLTADPELRFTPGGQAVASFTVASTPRRYDQGRSEWVDGDTLFARCSAWRDLAQHIAESLHKGSRVVVIGRVVQREYDDREGKRHTVWEVQADEVAASLSFATAVITRVPRTAAA